MDCLLQSTKVFLTAVGLTALKTKKIKKVGR